MNTALGRKRTTGILVLPFQRYIYKYMTQRQRGQRTELRALLSSFNTSNTWRTVKIVHYILHTANFTPPALCIFTTWAFVVYVMSLLVTALWLRIQNEQSSLSKTKVPSMPWVLTVISEHYLQAKQNNASCQTPLGLSKLLWGLSWFNFEVDFSDYSNIQLSHWEDRAVIAWIRALQHSNVWSL